MATKSGKFATLRDINIPSSKIPGWAQGSKLRLFYDEFTLTADLAVNDVINMFKLPAGAVVVDMVCDSPDLDTQSAGALTVGWADNGVDAVDADGFITTMDVHTAGKTSSMSGLLASNAPGKLKQFTNETQVQVTISGETDATSGTIRLYALVAVA